MTNPTAVAKIIERIEMTIVSTRPRRKASLGVNKLAQKNCQSKFIVAELPLLFDAQVSLAPLFQDAAVGTVSLQLRECLLNGCVQPGIPFQGSRADHDVAKRTARQLDFRGGFCHVVAERFSSVQV